MEIGRLIGPYKILAQIGSGGMGEVYRATDTRLDRDVAVKVLSQHLIGDPEALSRFEKEAKAVASLSHTNILAIHDFDHEGPTYYTVTEFLDGENLRQRIQRSPVPWRKAMEIGISIAEGLAAAHAKGIVHRDLKPENIFITNEGHVKILDFGLAQIPKKQTEQHGVSEAETQEAIVGTVGYMSPEQIAGNPGDPRSDIFSLGCVLYEMVTGSRAFWGVNAYETVAAILKEDPAEISASGKQVPFEFQRIIMHCLEKNPAERCQSALDLAFDIRNSIHSNTSKTEPVSGISSRFKLSRIITVILTIVAVAAFFALWRKNSIQSIAVLPFQNQTGDAGQEYLSDGIPETIINQLSQIPRLRVIARSTAFRFKNSNTDLKDAGMQMNVDAILTGTVQNQNDSIVVNVELVRISDGTLLWGQKYVRKSNEMLPVDDDLSIQIAERLKIQLTGEEQRRLSKRYTENTEAYTLYLKGRYQANKRNEDGFRKGILYFQQAVAVDPNYALAYAGLADAYALMGDYSLVPPDEAFTNAREAAKKALQLDNELAEAYTSLGHISMYYWKWEDTEKNFHRAIDLKPGYATAHHWYANYLAVMGRHDESIEQVKLALKLDPFSLIINEALGYHLYLARRYEEAIRQQRRTLDLDPDFAPAYSGLACALAATGKFREAIQYHLRAVRLSPSVSDYKLELAATQARSGNVGDAQKTLNEVLEPVRNQYLSAPLVAKVYAWMQNRESAIEWLQKAYDEHSEILPFMIVDPDFDSLRTEPQFQRLMRRIGLTPSGNP